MIVSNHQQNIFYYKQYPCYSLTTHLSEHRQMQFANVTYVQFSNQTSPKRDLPKYFIDQYQAPHKMYWLEWTMEDVSTAVIEQGKNRINQLFYDNQSNNNKSSHISTQTSKKKHYRCLYIAQLGKVAHIKLVFNYDPEIVGICQDFIYTVGGNQLIITELWPQNVQSLKNIDSTKQLPPKQSQIVHKLDPQSKVLSLDFVQDEQKNVVCKIIYFNDKKGIYAQTYKKYQSSQNSLLNKLFDFSLKFKKNESQPLYYQTLVPNILGIVILKSKQFMLFNLTEMKPLLNTKMTLQGWQLNHHQPVFVKSRQNQTLQNFNDCLTIAIGQGSKIEIFLFHIRYLSTATLYLPKQDNKVPTSQLQKWPIHMFTSGQFIDFESSILKHLTIVHLQKVSLLSNFILSKSSLVYLGYEKSVNGSISSQQLLIAGFVNYNSPYITHEILMQENKIWRQYKIDVLMGMNENNINKYEQNLQRLLTPGRYDISFILKTLNLNKITDLNQLVMSRQLSMKQINQRLLFQWRNEYKFVQFVTYREQFLIIRKNSIGTLIDITFEQYISSKDRNSQIQISYNKLLSRGFDAKFDIQGDRYIEQQNGLVYENMMDSILDKSVRCYQDKIRTINGRIKDFMAQKELLMENQRQQKMPVGDYYDQEEYKKYSKLYERTLHKIIEMSKQPSLIPLPQRSFTNNNNINLQQQQHQHIPLLTTHNDKQILLHASILSLRVKDQLIYLIDTLKMNYQYYFQQLLKEKKLQQQKNNNKKIITVDMLQRVHLQHIYIVYILEWINSISTKTHLQQQYQYFNNDLIQQFVNYYIQKHCKGSYIQQNGTVLTTDYRLFKSDIITHVKNVFSLMFRGLIVGLDYGLESDNIVQHVREVEEMSQQEIVTDRINKINKQANPLLMLLLKKHHEIKHLNKFIGEGLVMSLIQGVILQKINQNLSLLIPINKTFIYSILVLPISKQQKLRILSTHMNSTQFLSILLLIQQQNNCYLMIEQGLQVELYQNDIEQFLNNTIRLSRENCCILQQLILTNYKLFLLPSDSRESNNKVVGGQRQQQHSSQQSMLVKHNITDPQLHQQINQLNKKISQQFIKYLFSNIDFMHLTFVITRPYSYSHQQQFNIQQDHYNSNRLGYNTQSEDNLYVGQYQNKSTAYVFRQLIQQVQKINENYGVIKGTPIQRTFKKFFNKIYHPRQKFNQSSQRQSQSYPQVTGLGNQFIKSFKDYHLSKQELDVIDRLYQKHLKLLKMDRKQTFQSTSIIQQRLNLEYSMIKIFMFRLNLALKEISTLTESDKRQYVEIMKLCVEGLKQSIKSFKHWWGKLSDQEREINDEEFLDIIIETDQMENSQVWNNNIDESYYQSQSEETNESTKSWGLQNWLIMDIPLSSQWLQLLLLTFNQATFYERPASRSGDVIFTNFQSLESVLMKMLIVIKKDRLQKQYESLKRLFGEDKIADVIEGNQMLKSLYADGLQSEKQQDLFGKYSKGVSLGLLSGRGGYEQMMI